MTNANPAVLFMRPYYAFNPWEQQSALFHPTLPHIGRTPKGLEQVHVSSGRNVGNFIHTEAMAQQIAFNRGRSGGLWLSEALKQTTIPALADKVNAEFDLVVFSTANFIRPESDFRQEARFFEKLRIPFILVGAGVQNLPAEGDMALSAGLTRFLQIVNAEARLFATRGDITAEYLHGLGLKNAKSLGCPSFYSFSDKIASVAAPDLTAVRSILTAGHAGVAAGPGQRFKRLHALLATLPAAARRDYVIQNELFWLAEDMDTEPVYDPASKQLDQGWTTRKFFRKEPALGADYRFHFFTDTSSWRMFAGMHDLYLGDRIHGGVVALQAGRPAAVIHGDMRVRELAAKIGLPAIALDAITPDTAAGLVADAFSPSSIAAMQTRYGQSLAVWRQEVARAGLVFVNP